MLFPQSNSYRHYVELNGLWEFRRDLEQQGEAKSWGDGFAPEGLLAVPASWNDQFATTEKREFIRTMFYQNTFYVPFESRGHAVRLRVGAVSFQASMWLNGEKLGNWNVAYLPFEFEVTRLVRYGEPNWLVIAVNNEQTMEMINQGRTCRGAERPPGRAHQGTPLIYQDFYVVNRLLEGDEKAWRRMAYLNRRWSLWPTPTMPSSPWPARWRRGPRPVAV